MNDALILGLFVILPCVAGSLLFLFARNQRKRNLNAGAAPGSESAPESSGGTGRVGWGRLIFGNTLVFLLLGSLALLAGEDPYLFRRARLTDARWIAVLDAAAALGNWNAPVPAGRARGIAIGKAFNSIVAEVIEISQPAAGSLKVHRVSCAVDCGRPVNPGSIQAQMQGGIVHGLNATLWGQQTFKAGVAQSANFNRSRMLRLNEMPQIDVTIMPPDPNVPIGGIGEPGVPTVAPALANAYARLTGQRIRTLPFFPGATMSGL